MVPGWNSAEPKSAALQPPPALPAGAGGVATLPAVRPGTADPGLVCNTTAGTPVAQQPAMPGSAGKSDGSNLFDALLLAASGGVDLLEPPDCWDEPLLQCCLALYRSHMLIRRVYCGQR